MYVLSQRPCLPIVAVDAAVAQAASSWKMNVTGWGVKLSSATKECVRQRMRHATKIAGPVSMSAPTYTINVTEVHDSKSTQTANWRKPSLPFSGGGSAFDVAGPPSTLPSDWPTSVCSAPPSAAEAWRKFDAEEEGETKRASTLRHVYVTRFLCLGARHLVRAHSRRLGPRCSLHPLFRW